MLTCTRRMISNARGGQVCSRYSDKPENKRYRISFFRRRRMHEHSSVTFGFIQGSYRGGGRVTPRHSIGNNVKCKHTFSWFVSGTSGSGKSTFSIRFLQNLIVLCTKPDFSGGIILCYSEISAIPYRQLAGREHVRFFEGVSTGFNNGGETPCLIILDDLLNDAYSKDV